MTYRTGRSNRSPFLGPRGAPLPLGQGVVFSGLAHVHQLRLTAKMSSPKLTQEIGQVLRLVAPSNSDQPQNYLQAVSRSVDDVLPIH